MNSWKVTTLTLPLSDELWLWGFNAGEIGVLSIHGISTVANVRWLNYLLQSNLKTIVGERDPHSECTSSAVKEG